MMQSFIGETCVIQHSDFVGNAIIHPLHGPGIIVDCEDLLAFAAEYVRSKRIDELGQADWKELLRGK